MKIILRTEQHRRRALSEISLLPLEPVSQVEISLYRAKRNTDQNRRMWAMLHDISRQVVWHGERLTPEEWKDVFTAALKRQRVTHGIDGGYVVLGTSTSKMSVAEMAELIELMFAFGAEHRVKWTDPTLPDEPYER